MRIWVCLSTYSALLKLYFANWKWNFSCFCSYLFCRRVKSMVGTSSSSPSTIPVVPLDQTYRGAEGGQTLFIDTNGPFYAKLFIFRKGPCPTGGVIHKNHFIKRTLFMRGLIPFSGVETVSHAWIPKEGEFISTMWIQTQVSVPAFRQWHPGATHRLR